MSATRTARPGAGRRDPPDQRVRDGAIRDLDTSIFLQAGAGTGKTSVLVGRLIEVVRTGRAELRETVAITFTEKAAGELRDRVRRELYHALQSADAAEAARLRRAIAQVDSAHIETIHAFASSLLRERPLDAGLDPNFTVLDAVSEQLAFDQDWQDWLWSEEEGSARPRIERCLRLGLRLDQLRGLAHTIAEFRDLAPRQQAQPVPPPQGEYEAALAAARSLRELAPAVSPAVDAQAQRLLEQLERLHDLPPPALEAELVNLDLPSARLRQGKGEARIRYKEALQQLADRHAAYAERVRSQALADFIEVTYEFVLSAAQGRRRSGTLNFQDLLIEARDLLLRESRVRHYFRDRFKFLFIDEFQDTDPLQAEIVMLLAARNDPRDWRDVELVPGRLFIVGDPKQSIYRFRRADIDIYADAEAIFRAAAEREPDSARVAVLEANFRSRPELVQWHNHVFSALIQRPASFPNAQPDYQRLTPFREEQGPAVIDLLPNTGVSWRRIGDARTDEATAIARFIETVVHSTELPVEVREKPAGEQPVGEKETGTQRPRYRDVCLLVRNRTNLEIYTGALDAAGIPYHLDSGRGFFLQQEIRDAAAILTALDDPSDEVAVVAALKSAPFAASDLELLEFVQAGGRFRLEPQSIPEQYDGALRGPLQQLLTLEERKATLPLPAFVDHVLRETHLMEIQLARGGAQRAANLQIIVQRAADFVANEVDSLRPFVRWLGTQTRTDLAEAESPVTEVEEDVVRILTIHQAKGLEFPIVVLAKMAAADAPDRSIAVVNREEERIDFQIGLRDRRFATPGYAAAQERQSVYERCEERRLLYVAATRARDWLVLPVFFTDRARGYHADLEEALPGWMNPDYEVEAPGVVTYRAEHLAPVRRVRKEITAPDAVALWKRWQATHQAALDAGKPRREFVVPSQLGHDLPKQARETEPPDHSAAAADRAAAAEDGSALAGSDAADSILLGADGGDGRARGIALHDALFLADFNDWDLSERRARKLCAERGLAELEGEVLADLRTTFGSEMFDRVRAAAHVERELPLVTVEPDRVSEGYVDLAFREADGWVLVDYKSDRQPSPDTIAGYERQVQEYARMFRHVGERVAEAYLLFTVSGKAHPVPLQ
ncbi:MAG: UvrD-helicase domain-containing protein [Dehalococcoidia bacterium]